MGAVQFSGSSGGCGLNRRQQTDQMADEEDQDAGVKEDYAPCQVPAAEQAARSIVLNMRFAIEAQPTAEENTAKAIYGYQPKRKTLAQSFIVSPSMGAAELWTSDRSPVSARYAQRSSAAKVPGERAIGDAAHITDVQGEGRWHRIDRLEHQDAASVVTARRITFPRGRTFFSVIAVQ
jgi:hypothetical protein